MTEPMMVRVEVWPVAADDAGVWLLSGLHPWEPLLPAGRPFMHGATEPPAPRRIDMLPHAIRHLSFLLDSDASASAALTEPWRSHLGALEPALAGRYGQESQMA